MVKMGVVQVEPGPQLLPHLRYPFFPAYQSLCDVSSNAQPPRCGALAHCKVWPHWPAFNLNPVIHEVMNRSRYLSTPKRTKDPNIPCVSYVLWSMMELAVY
jgi:hypothetical protein